MKMFALNNYIQSTVFSAISNFKRCVFCASIPCSFYLESHLLFCQNFLTGCIHTSFFKRTWRWYFFSFPSNSGFVWLCAVLTCGMYCVTFAVFLWLIAFSLWYKGSLVSACCLQPWWSSRLETCHVHIVNHHLHAFTQGCGTSTLNRLCLTHSH